MGACEKARRETSRPDGTAIADVAAAAVPSAVRIRGGGGMAQGVGSGFLIAGATGGELVVTNAHVVWGATSLTVDTFDGQSLLADVVGSDPEVDIAVLRCRSPHRSGHTLSFVPKDRLRIGEWVVSIGSAGGVLNTVSIGVLSARGKVPNATLAAQKLIDHLFVDGVASPGNSGGPILDLNGGVVGVNAAVIGGSHLGVVIPASVVEPVVSAIENHGRFRHSSIGVQLRNETNIDGTVAPTVVTCARECGDGAFREGDRILSVEREEVHNVSEFERRVFMSAPGTRWNFSVLRGGSRVSISVQLQEMTQGEFSQQRAVAPSPGQLGSLLGAKDVAAR